MSSFPMFAATGTPAALATASSVGARLTTFLTFAPPVASQVFWVAPLPTMRAAVRARSTEGLPPLPYFSMLVNGFLWSAYGVTANMDPTIILPNISGMLAGLYWCWLFARYDSGRFEVQPYRRGAVAAVAAVSFVVASLPPRAAQRVLGWAGCIVCVVMFSGPLQVIRAVLQTRSTKDLPFAMAVATVTNCALWLGYGALVIGDPFIWAPNTLGLASGVVQLALFARFGFQRAPPHGGLPLKRGGGGAAGELAAQQGGLAAA
eukprot:g7868.t1